MRSTRVQCEPGRGPLRSREQNSRSGRAGRPAELGGSSQARANAQCGRRWPGRCPGRRPPPRRQPGEEPELDQLGLHAGRAAASASRASSRATRSSSGVVGGGGRRRRGRPARGRRRACRRPCGGRLDEDAAHGLGGGGEEVARGRSSTGSRSAADQAQVGLVDQGGGLERLPGLLGRQLSRRRACGARRRRAGSSSSAACGSPADGRVEELGDVGHGVDSTRRQTRGQRPLRRRIENVQVSLNIVQQHPVPQPAAGSRCEKNPLPEKAGGEAEHASPCEMLRDAAQSSSGAEEIRTLDLCSAIAALYQLSYRPGHVHNRRRAGASKGKLSLAAWLGSDIRTSPAGGGSSPEKSSPVRRPSVP